MHNTSHFSSQQGYVTRRRAQTLRANTLHRQTTDIQTASVCLIEKDKRSGGEPAGETRRRGRGRLRRHLRTTQQASAPARPRPPSVRPAPPLRPGTTNKFSSALARNLALRSPCPWGVPRRDVVNVARGRQAEESEMSRGNEAREVGTRNPGGSRRSQEVFRVESDSESRGHGDAGHG